MGPMITISGNLGATPELAVTPNGKATVRLRAAVDSRHRTTGGEWVDGPTSWYKVIAWDRLAENVVEHAIEGDRVVVHGRLEQREWATEAGETRTAWEITAEDIGLSLRMAAPGAREQTVSDEPRVAAQPARHGRAGSRSAARARV